MKVIKLILLLIILLASFISAQKNEFTHQDTLRGSITQERSWWDLQYYHLKIKVNPEEKYLIGENTIKYQVLNSYQTMQIDLQPPMLITKVLQNNKELQFKRDGNAYFIELSEKQNAGDIKEIVVSFEGKPKESARPPWDGGVTWTKDKNGNDFIVTTCQGDGASLWWACKDHMYDEPDSMLISVTVPNPLLNVSNGRLRKIEQNPDNTNTSHWFVSNPINNYGVNINVGDYVHFSEKYNGEKGILDCDYYVLSYNLEKAKEYFKEVPRMLEALEYWFGPYPFYEDSYKLVEVPYFGMEHQSSVTYGNGYTTGFHGTDVSGTGIGFKFDFIIVHESAHEWFANSITYKDIADMWIHESFAAYSENLFADYFFGKEDCTKYVIGTRKNIQNDRPIIGTYNVNYSGSGDMYPKGANMLHTLRQIVNNDKKWRNILRGLSEEFYHQTVTTEQIENYFSKSLNMDLNSFFNQYLRDVRIPVLEYSINENVIKYRWGNCVEGFNIPVKVYINNSGTWLYPSTVWKETKQQTKIDDLKVDENFYVTSEGRKS